MLTLHTKIEQAEAISDQLVLPYDLREKSRQRATLTSGEEVAVFTVRGTVLRDGDLLKGDDGRVVQIVAAHEPTYRVECPRHATCCVALFTSAIDTPRRKSAAMPPADFCVSARTASSRKCWKGWAQP